MHADSVERVEVCVCVACYLFRSRMLDVVHMWNDEVESFYSEQIVNQKRIYSQRFAMASHTSAAVSF